MLLKIGPNVEKYKAMRKLWAYTGKNGRGNEPAHPCALTGREVKRTQKPHQGAEKQRRKAERRKKETLAQNTAETNEKAEGVGKQHKPKRARGDNRETSGTMEKGTNQESTKNTPPRKWPREDRKKNQRKTETTAVFLGIT